MHLKSLTLKGFKSFASATTLRFEPGITCVVGPNGSGKSNVVDALSWVMGEQGAKALRGGKMQDVIFAGTSGRAPLGRAEVTLTIDNSDGALPIEYSEVSITRRMFRDGAGEYEINGSSCRLMDVQELLSDSGIGREMHVIVGQGQLSAILESRPEDRRAFIEEAAGVLKHRRRKEKAVRKLEAMQANLARLTDLTTELRRQLKPLGRQAEVARRAATVQADLRDARLRLAADDLVTRRRELESQQSKEAFAREQQINVQTELDAANAALAQQEFQLSRLTPGAEAAAQTWFQLSALVERVNATIRIARDRARNLTIEQPTGTGRDPEQLEAEAARVEAEEAELLEAVEIATETLEAARDQLHEREQAAKAAEQAHLAAVRAIADRREGLARLSGQVDNLRTRAQSADSEIARLSAALAEARLRGESAEAEFESVQAELSELDAGEESLDAAYEHAAQALELAEERVAELREKDREASKKVASLTARIEALTIGLARRDGGAWLLEHRGDGLLGPLSAMLRVHNGFEVAVAAALGPLADAVAAGSGDAAHAALRALREADGGRAALVFGGAAAAGSGLHEVGGGNRGALPGSARWLADVVDCSDAVREGISALTARTVVVDDLAAAAEVLAGQPELRVVTRDGDLAGTGWVVGGSDRAPSQLEIQADIDSARGELESWQRQAGELEAALAGALAEQTDRKESVDQALLALHESDQALVSIYDRLGRLGEAARSAQTESERLLAQRAEAETARDANSDRLAELEQRLRHAESEQSDLDSDSDAGTETAGQEREEAAAALAEARAMEVEARLAVRTAEERAESVRGKADSLRRAARAERDSRARAERAQAARRRAAEVAAVVAESAERVAAELETVVAEAAARRDDLVRRRTECAAQVDQTKERTRALSAQLTQLTDAVHRDEVARAQSALRIEQLEQTIGEQFGIALDDLIAEYGPHVPMPPSALEMQEYEQARERGDQVSQPQPMPFDRASQERRAKRAEKDLTTLGKVNPLALEEFAALEERYNFLATQLEDVRKARQDLLDVVAEVDARILQVFTEAYEDVEREFVQVFAKLFPGGEGRLLLTDPSDMLATGIEVEARPPGKKVKRLSLLSGGEKSLTAVALLVAIFRARPSPFYVMDEVEAALDDTNLRRLIGLFEQLRDRSQLIVITHQKPTMEIADALYGVSMRGDGITQVISQRMRGENLVGSPA
ncbi:chromosome segregation protein SMC [Nocardia terpenica]|uniref:chromosome segregation protein SMC n=1 Tax=Nocardia terpenica TaxID=455432 RepID=UPI0018934461|nr:chromosome segregation protein SMC [Nocardia terpenica]MBF6066299.1 chromosome segregation protein SMC [Nocardia terpenica]MBF6108571.1 chromosome segregation protein SMC [Nocardia terpenica]MBF6116117.1 chromosome segregation protein SMC [Nocardia terpenica]MBF6123762.1 chromosome segregation protein SMC [Nocardia terpenica]MBF6157091.1 chromosome segregation protein SMC [Nocardia terpenica]